MEATVFLFIINDIQKISIQSKKLWNKTIYIILQNISKDFTANNMEKARFNRYFYDFSVDNNTIDTSTIDI